MTFKTAYLLVLTSTVLQAQIVTTINPFRTILQELLPGSIDVKHLVAPSASPHTYELLPSDLRAVENSKILVFGGAGLDNWVKKIPRIHKVSVLKMIPDSLQIKSLDKDHGFMNPHFWTDPMLVKKLLPALADTLSKYFPSLYDSIQIRKKLFESQIEHLHEQVREMLYPYRGSSVVSSHPFFDYFLRRYKMKSVFTLEAIPGKEATPRRIQNIIQAISEKEVRLILTHRQLNDRTAQMIAEYTGIPILELDPLGALISEITYSELIYADAARLLKALE